MSKSASDVLVVGAGPTGLFLALVLAKLGVRPRVVDAADAPGTTSRALAVQARTLELCTRGSSEPSATRPWARRR